MSVPLLTAFGLYLAGMLALGLVAYRKTTDLPDYILGGRRLRPSVAALSAGASDMSGWLLLGLPGAVYAFGLNQIWIAIGLSVGAYLNWRLVAPRLRRYTEIGPDALTLPDYLALRFPERERALRILSAGVILFFFAIYTAAGLVAGAVLFEATFGLDYRTALWIGAAVIVSYTFLGGFLAVSWTDAVQGCLMFAALLLVPALASIDLGGLGAVTGSIGALGAEKFDVFAELSFLAVLSLMAWGLGYFGQPHILARFMAIRSSAETPIACRIGMTWMIVSLAGAVATGFVAIAYFAEAPLDNPETAFIALTQALFSPWVAGVLLAAVLAAIMSTVDSQLLVSSSVLTQDLYRPFFRKSASDGELLWVGRGTVVAIAVLASLLALNPESRVLALVAYAWAGFGAAFGAPILLSLLWPRTTGTGVVAGMVVGAATVVVWANLDGGLFDLYEILPGFAAALATIVGVSLADRAPDRATVALIERLGRADA